MPIFPLQASFIYLLVPYGVSKWQFFTNLQPILSFKIFKKIACPSLRFRGVSPRADIFDRKNENQTEKTKQKQKNLIRTKSIKNGNQMVTRPKTVTDFRLPNGLWYNVSFEVHKVRFYRTEPNFFF